MSGNIDGLGDEEEVGNNGSEHLRSAVNVRQDGNCEETEGEVGKSKTGDFKKETFQECHI
jgi:hypothetical protein